VPDAEIAGVLVRGMIPAGHEVILGAKRDPAFGPVLMFGLGGVHVELFGDVTFGLAPMSQSGAEAMLRRVKAFRLLEGFRGSEPADIVGIRECLVRLGQLVDDFHQIAELDINPLIVGSPEEGVAVADVRIRLREPSEEAEEHDGNGRARRQPTATQ
jgi:acyl-CoA synthetase (NDP forming)